MDSFADDDKPQIRQFSEGTFEAGGICARMISWGLEEIRELRISAMEYIPCISAEHSIWQISFSGNPDLNCKMIPIPNPVGEESLPINVDIALGYSVDTEYPELCEAFIEFMSRPEIYQIMADNEGTPTCIEGVGV